MFGAALSSAQTFPMRPVRIVVPYPPGGPNDIVARIAAQRLLDIWQQATVVDNRSGAGGNIGMELVAKSSPDGYTVCVGLNLYALSYTNGSVNSPSRKPRPGPR